MDEHQYQKVTSNYRSECKDRLNYNGIKGDCVMRIDNKCLQKPKTNIIQTGPSWSLVHPLQQKTRRVLTSVNINLENMMQITQKKNEEREDSLHWCLCGHFVR